LLRRQFGGDVLQQVPAEDIVNLQSVDRLPVILAGLVSLVGIVTVGNVLRLSVLQRRRELALLKTIGFRRGQVAVTVATQAIMFSAVALVLGLAIGIGLGRLAWSLVTASLGSASPAQLPVSLLALIVPVTLTASLCAAAGPGWSATKVAPATTIRRD
jgi:putative ABC transport system permease protein